MVSQDQNVTRLNKVRGNGMVSWGRSLFSIMGLYTGLFWNACPSWMCVCVCVSTRSRAGCVCACVSVIGHFCDTQGSFTGLFWHAYLRSRRVRHVRVLAHIIFGKLEQGPPLARPEERERGRERQRQRQRQRDRQREANLSKALLLPALEREGGGERDREREANLSKALL